MFNESKVKYQKNQWKEQKKTKAVVFNLINFVESISMFIVIHWLKTKQNKCNPNIM